MARKHELVVKDFRDNNKRADGSRIFIRDNRIYSYGTHFTLAVKPKGERQDFGAGIKYIINADRYSSSTTGHTNLCINTLKDNVQIPFSAIWAAGYENGYSHPHVEDISILDNRPDKSWTECSTCEREVRYLTYDEAEYAKGFVHVHKDDGTPVCIPKEENASETRWNHILGAVLFTFGDGKFYLSSTDENEPAHLRSYFLSQLPYEVETIEQAYESLKPEPIREAMGMGLQVKRQGDIFLLPTELPTRLIKGEKFRQHAVLETTHVATEARVNGHTAIRGFLRHKPLDRWGNPRRPQHKTVKLGKLWHLAFRNTALASFNAAGNVD